MMNVRKKIVKRIFFWLRIVMQTCQVQCTYQYLFVTMYLVLCCQLSMHVQLLIGKPLLKFAFSLTLYYALVYSNCPFHQNPILYLLP